jgi:NAD(P)-dependent dehydrogenase (short-subunit alcohol dehydrogenase family)
MSDELRGHVLAIVGRGTDLDRAIAVQCAELGASIALGTVADVQEQEFAVNSIANEIWSIGQPNLVHQMYAWEADAAAAFAAECTERLGPCDTLVVNSSAWSHAPFEELTEAEWEATIRANLTVPFMQVQAFARLMAKRGNGLVIVISPTPDEGDIAETAAFGGLEAMFARLETWGGRDNVGFAILDRTARYPEQAAQDVVRLIVECATADDAAM